MTGPLAPGVVDCHGATLWSGFMGFRGWWWRLRRRFKKRGAAFAAGCVEGLCSLALRGRRPFGPKVVDCRSAAMLIKSALRDLLSVSYVMISILRGEGGAVRHQRGRMHFHRPQGGCMVFAAKGGIKNGARKGVIPSQRARSANQ